MAQPYAIEWFEWNGDYFVADPATNQWRQATSEEGEKLRTRDIQIGTYVRVRNYATGRAALYRGKVGKVVQTGSTTRNGHPHINFGGDNAVAIEARWLEGPVDAPPPEEPTELVAFKAKLAETAQRYARAYNLCEVVDEFLREMDVEPLPAQKVRLVLEIDEATWNEYLEGDEHQDRLTDAVITLKGILDDRSSRECSEFLKSAQYVPNTEETE